MARKYEDWSREQIIARLEKLEIESKRRRSCSPLRRSQATRPFVFSASGLRKIALKFCYSGWEYGGLAFQPPPLPLPTVEGVLFAALVRARLVDGSLGIQGCGWEKCGRTDRGVSAAGQVVSFWVRSSLPMGSEGIVDVATAAEEIERAGAISHKKNDDNEQPISSPLADAAPPLNDATCAKEHDYVGILNRLLPVTIRAIAWSPVASTFSARFSCIFRHYKYFFPARGLDVQCMRAAAERIVGTHDFRNFCKLDVERQITVFDRHITRADIEPVSDGTEGMLVFNLVGNAFLYHQVRHIMSALLLVGTGLEEPSVISALLNVHQNAELDDSLPTVDCKPVYQMADSLPLMLWECGYNEAQVQWRTGRSGDTLYHTMDAVLQRSQIYSTLNAYFLAAAMQHHTPPPDHFPIYEQDGIRPTMNIPLGGGTFHRTAKYTPLLQRDRISAVEVANERWRIGKGLRREEKRKLAQEAQML